MLAINNKNPTDFQITAKRCLFSHFCELSEIICLNKYAGIPFPNDRVINPGH